MKKNHFKFRNRELIQLTKNAENLVLQTTSIKHIAIPPIYLKDLKSSITDHLDQQLGKFDSSLNGILLGYNNIKLLEDVGSILYEDSYVHIDFKVNCFVFQPEVDSILSGQINKVAKKYISILVHKCFNVNIPRENEDTWIGNNSKIGDTVQFRIEFFNSSEQAPFIKGKLINILSKKDNNSLTENHKDLIDEQNETFENDQTFGDKTICFDLNSIEKSKASTSKKSILNSPKNKSLDIKNSVESKNNSDNLLELKNNSKDNKKSKKKLINRFEATFEINETIKEDEKIGNFLANLNNIIDVKKSETENLSEKKSSKKQKPNKEIKKEIDDQQNITIKSEVSKKSNSNHTSPEKKECSTNLNNVSINEDDLNELALYIKEEKDSTKKNKKSKKSINIKIPQVSSPVKLTEETPKKNKETKKTKNEIEIKTNPSPNKSLKVDKFISDFVSSLSSKYIQNKTNETKIEPIDKNEGEESTSKKKKKKRTKDIDQEPYTPKKVDLSQESIPDDKLISAFVSSLSSKYIQNKTNETKIEPIDKNEGEESTSKKKKKKRTKDIDQEPHTPKKVNLDLSQESIPDDKLISAFVSSLSSKSIQDKTNETKIEPIDKNEGEEFTSKKMKKKRKIDIDQELHTPKKERLDLSQESIPDLSNLIKNSLVTPISNSINQKSKRVEMTALSEIKKSKKSLNKSSIEPGLILFDPPNDDINHNNVEEFINTSITTTRNSNQKKEKKHKPRKSSKGDSLDIYKITDNLLNTYLGKIQ